MRSASTWETSKSQREEGNLGIITLNPSFHPERTIQVEPDRQGLDREQGMPGYHRIQGVSDHSQV
jgi:hypothetical protein